MANNKFKVDKEAKVHKEDKEDNKIPTRDHQDSIATMNSATLPDSMCTAPKNITTKTRFKLLT